MICLKNAVKIHARLVYMHTNGWRTSVFYSPSSPCLILACLMLQCDKMVMVACGWRHTISVSSSGGLYTYGWSKYGQLGHGNFEDSLVPQKLQALSDKLISQVVL